jgi:hypothetical protein
MCLTEENFEIVIIEVERAIQGGKIIKMEGVAKHKVLDEINPNI